MNLRFLCWFPAFLILGCGSSEETELVALAEHLEPEAREALVAPEAAWAHYCREAGLPALQETARILRESPQLLETEESYRASHQTLRPYLERVSRCLRDDYLFAGEWTEYEAWSHRTFEQARDLDRLKVEHQLVARDLPGEERLRIYEEIERGFRAVNSVNGVVNALSSQAMVYRDGRDMAAALALLRMALSERETAGRHTMTMATLITMGTLFGAQGEVDSMLTYYDRALSMAKESRDPVTGTRALRHLRLYYESLGQEAVAFELLKESSKLCREFKGDNYDLISILDAAGHYIRYGDPGMVEDLLERCEPVLAHAKAKAHHSVQDSLRWGLVAIEIGLFKGRHLIATGRTEEGEVLFRDLRTKARKYGEKFPQLLYFWSSAHLEANHPQQAAKLAREGLADADSAKLDFESIRLSLVLADASCRLGQSAEAEKSLDRFQKLVGKEEATYRAQYMIHDRVRVCLALAAGDTIGAERAAQAGLSRLERLLKPLDQSVQACLFLDDCREFREAVHQVLSKNAEAGYGFEMAWRSLYGVLGNGAKNNGGSVFAGTNGSLTRHCALLGHRIQKQVANAGGVHCVYFANSKGIVRWTASKEGIDRANVPVAPDELKRDIEMVTNILTSAPNDSWNRDLESSLTRLNTILPAFVQDPQTPAPLFISPDLYLSNLPFEAINQNRTNGYRPVLETWDVAYLRGHQIHTSRGAKRVHGMTLVSPEYPAFLRRRYPTLTPLPYGEKEAALVTATFPGTVSLDGSAATKLAFAAHSEASGFIYVASHFIQSAETPYVSYLPLSAGDSAALGDAVLDYGEIRKTNLSGCNLVVLSGCGTGVSYSNAQVVAPSLSDAFLDAGAKAVIHTRWRVRDNEAYELASSFIKLWSQGEEPVVALNETKRAAWHKSHGLSTDWTSYSITLSEIPKKPLRNGRSRS